MIRDRDIRYFVVCGTGVFPYDMLRYDQCWPVDTESATAMSYDPLAPKESRHKLRIVKLATVGQFAPTLARWTSFTWAASQATHSMYELNETARRTLPDKAAAKIE